MENLILIPTEMERCRVAKRYAFAGTAQLCGFGLVMAGVRAAQLIAQLSPERVLLLGIAGSLSNRLPLGTAVCFRSVTCDGIGAGTGTNFQTAEDLGWKLWPGPPEVGNRILLDTPAGCDNLGELHLLSCASASGCPQDAEHRRCQYPNVDAEDMEAFAVAAACAIHHIPLTVIRGISNLAGNRDHQQWRISDALDAAGQLADEVIAR